MHLVGFYGQAGFREYTSGEAPLFLAERLANYRKRGLQVLLMHRPVLHSHDV